MIKIKKITFILIQDLEDVYLRNLTSDYLPFALDIQKENNPDYYEAVETGTINPLALYRVPTTLQGKYRVRIGEEVIYFSLVNLIRDEVIKSVRRALCDCGCTDCSRCEDKEGKTAKRNQSLYTLLNSYINLVKPFSTELPARYNNLLFNFYQTIFNKNNLRLQCDVANQVLQTKITGLPYTNPDLTNYNTAVYYLGLYFYYKYSFTSGYELSTTQAKQLKHVDEVFNFKSISKCVAKLGICLKEYEAIYVQIVAETPDDIPTPEPEPVYRKFVVGITPLNPVYTENDSEGLELTCNTIALGEGTTVDTYIWEITFSSDGEASGATVFNSVTELNKAILDGTASVGEYGIKVTAFNDASQLATAFTTVTYVKDDTPKRFVISAGEDQVNYVTNFTNVNSSVVSLGGGTSVISYLWELISMFPAIDSIAPIIVSPLEPATAINNVDVLTTFTYRVTAVNNIGETATDDMTILHYPEDRKLEFTVGITGEDIVNSDPTFLKGYTTGEEEGEEIISVLWRYMRSVPEILTDDHPVISNNSNLITTVSNLKAGVANKFRLQAETNLGNTSFEEKTITYIP